jgi:DNA-binding beta-propeller fold protein YncE
MNRASKFTNVAVIAFMQIALVSATAIEVSAADTDYELKPINLPGATGPVALDYFAYDRATGKLWVPASNTGSVDVIDEGTDAISQVTGFGTGEIERRGRKITVGPTAATVGEGVIYIGDRGNATLCVIDAKTLARGECVPVSADRAVTSDGVVYVAAAREVWITLRVKAGDNAPAKCLEILDASDPHHLKPKTKIPLENLAEGYAVDNQRGIFFTNIEDAGNTVAIDVHTHKVIATWNPGSSDLEGLALDDARNFLFVACGDHVVSIDAGHGGKVIDSITTGSGLDNIDYSSDRKFLYAAASQAATLTIAEIDDNGKFHLKATVPTVKGARGVVAGKGLNAYLIDPAEGRMLKLTRKSDSPLSILSKNNRFADSRPRQVVELAGRREKHPLITIRLNL